MFVANGEGAPRCFDSGDAQGCVGWRTRRTLNKPDQPQAQRLYYGRARHPLVEVVPDELWAGMWRLRWPDGQVSDLTNIDRAKDAAVAICERGPPGRNRRRLHWEIQRSNSPPEASLVRGNGRGA
jgi:hypothetical protein